ncbi:MAG: hypothetical protein EA369_04665 [Bradymonadales bacterium]|nr:MAG: hypothetical protein EA369_04665 [Bradymonadales bacterium]
MAELQAQNRLEVRIEIPQPSAEMTRVLKNFMDQQVCEDFEPLDFLPPAGGPLQYFAAWLEPLEASELKTAPSSQRKRMEISGCKASSAVTFLNPGDELEIRSKDPITYDLSFFESSGGRATRLLPPNLMAARLQWTEPNTVEARCELHPNLRFAVIVSPSPWRGFAGSDTKLSLENIPRGQYRLQLWHPVLGSKIYSRPIDIQERSSQILVRWS